MIWKISFLLASFNVLIIVPRTYQSFPEEEYLEELYNVEIVESLNSMPTLDETDITLNGNDIHLLTIECYPNENCLKKKKGSIKKYRQKMQAIQCIHGLFVLKALNELEAIFKKSDYIGDLKQPVKKHQDYLKKMLSLLNMAKWDAYEWQIEMFTFVEGLAALDAKFEKYQKHFMVNSERMREKLLLFVIRCVQHKYLFYPGDTTSEISTISLLADGVYSQMESLYKGGQTVAYRFLGHYEVPLLMLQPLYLKEDFIFEWSMDGFKLETSNVKRQLRKYVGLYVPKQLHHQWELDPIGGNKYNALISKCIYLRLVFAAWFHLHTYRTLQSRSSDAIAVAPLSRIWKTLVEPLKRALRLFGFTENIYWSALNVMRVDLKNISKEQLAAREEITRYYFCHVAEDLGLGNAIDINLQLKNIEVTENHRLTYKRIKANAEMVDSYTVDIILAIKPVDGAFIRLIVSAEGNEKFVMH